MKTSIFLIAFPNMCRKSFQAKGLGKSPSTKSIENLGWQLRAQGILPYVLNYSSSRPTVNIFFYDSITELTMRCCVLGKDTLRVFPIGAKQSSRCGGLC